MTMKRVTLGWLALLLPLAGWGGIAESPEAVQPLRVGDRAPDATLVRMDGGTIGIAEAYKELPLVLVFYRGGWCPYCTKHLKAIGKVIPELTELGFQVIGISPDARDSIASGTEKVHDYILLTQDEDFAAVEAYGLGFAVDDDTLGKLKSYDIALRARPSDGANILPVPAVFVVDTEGVIRFVHYDPNYKKRLSPKKILEAARDVAGR